ncbi:hypothetical protein WG901_20350 [Novosphingobium sp. PS1R-30]|uniref:Uncharacterized protein n=1 Tax=Novosphingobium anseongense TaxID=3133436 RepID=A0ABU8S0Y7_9SPHN
MTDKLVRLLESSFMSHPDTLHFGALGRRELFRMAAATAAASAALADQDHVRRMRDIVVSERRRLALRSAGLSHR